MSTHQLTPIRMATIQKKRNRNSLCWEGCGEIGTHTHCCWEHKMGQPLWKTVEQLLERLKIKLPHDAAIPRGSTDPKELTAGLCRGICTPLFTAALFTIAEMWKPVQASVGRGTDKQNVVYMHNGVSLTLQKEGHSDTRYRMDGP